MDVQINDLKDVARVILGGKSLSEAIGNDPPRYVFIEPDGEMEGLDNLRACADGLSRIKLNVLQSRFHRAPQNGNHACARYFRRHAARESVPPVQGGRTRAAAVIWRTAIRALAVLTIPASGAATC